ncbi:protein translocase subunit SecF [Aquihabitans sp. McL0605]|uniref:protein translocase subunit SecF n=1 Tax=Aquihabitans sp. McL0605 TaxID=3415671 RepID=UPI003CEA9B33
MSNDDIDGTEDAVNEPTEAPTETEPVEDEVDSVADLEAIAAIPVRHRSGFSRLYHGETNINFIGRWKLWFGISAVFLLIGLVALVGNGLNLGIDFTGGTVWEVPAGKADVAEVTKAMGDLGYNDVQVQLVTQGTGSGEKKLLRVEAEASSSPDKATTKALDQASSDLSSIKSKLKGESKSKVDAVQANLDSVDGPFKEAVPTPLKTLQSQIDDLSKSVSDGKATDKVVTASTADMQKQVSALDALEQAEVERVGQAVTKELASLTGSNVKDVTVDTVGPSWGQQISAKARTALIVFLIVISLYITLRFEFRMAMATLAALVHDLLIVVGIYAIFQFPVTPATVIALLTILGFSIYDGIVVFDRVDENTKLLGRKAKMTYSEMANMSLNQVLMRSLNTSITALLPIFTVLVLGSFVLGATTLEEFGLALFLGLLSGAYSSIFIATPMLAILKEREPRYRELRERVDKHASTEADLVAAFATTGAEAGGRTVAGDGGVVPKARKQGKKR